MKEFGLLPFLALGLKMANGQGSLGNCGDFCHPFPDKHREKNPLSPETGTEQPNSVVMTCILEERPELKVMQERLRKKPSAYHVFHCPLILPFLPHSQGINLVICRSPPPQSSSALEKEFYQCLCWAGPECGLEVKPG